MLLWSSSGFRKIFCLRRLGFRAGQNLLELARDVPLETADDLFLGQPLTRTALHVGAGAGVVSMRETAMM
jgi:hypothetical protein